LTLYCEVKINIAHYLMNCCKSVSISYYIIKQALSIKEVIKLPLHGACDWQRTQD